MIRLAPLLLLAACGSPNATNDGQAFKFILPSCLISCRSDIKAENTRFVDSARVTPTTTKRP